MSSYLAACLHVSAGTGIALSLEVKACLDASDSENWPVYHVTVVYPTPALISSHILHM